MARSRAALVVLGLTATFAPGDAASSPGVDTAPALVAARRASLERSLGAFAARIASRTTLSPGAEQARAALELARRRGKSLDLVAYRATLTAILRTSVDAAHELAHCLRELGRADATLAFSTALALAPWVDAGAAETLLDGLANEADPRPALVVALRGSAEPRVDRALVALYEADPDTAVRGAAAGALADRLDRVEPELVRRARARAWRDLEEGDAGSGADVLGAGMLSGSERDRLMRLASSSTADRARRVAALRVLASTGARPDELRPILDTLMPPSRTTN